MKKRNDCCKCNANKLGNILIIFALVHRIKSHYCGNLALCGKSVKLGTHLYDTYRCKFSYSAISGSALGGGGMAGIS